jgi:pyruvate/2-oxoglutarate dehydrogenase complex dihydrolipoamide acyltransferase (E2) component
MSWTQTDLDALDRAIASGVKVVRYDGPPARSVEYHSLDEMMRLRSEVAREASGQSARRYRYARTRKGLNP